MFSFRIAHMQFQENGLVKKMGKMPTVIKLPRMIEEIEVRP